MERADGSRWVLIIGGAGAAVAALAMLIEYENKRQRRFIAGRGSRAGGVDKKAIQEAISSTSAAQMISPDGNRQQKTDTTVEHLLPKTFFAASVPEDKRDRKSTGDKQSSGEATASVFRCACAIW